MRSEYDDGVHATMLPEMTIHVIDDGAEVRRSLAFLEVSGESASRSEANCREIWKMVGPAGLEPATKRL